MRKATIVGAVLLFIAACDDSDPPARDGGVDSVAMEVGVEVAPEVGVEVAVDQRTDTADSGADTADTGGDVGEVRIPCGGTCPVGTECGVLPTSTAETCNVCGGKDQNCCRLDTCREGTCKQEIGGPITGTCRM